jgi:hypothetical protein
MLTTEHLVRFDEFTRTEQEAIYKAPTIHISEVSIYSDIKPTGRCAVSKNRPTLVKTSTYRRM